MLPTGAVVFLVTQRNYRFISLQSCLAQFPQLLGKQNDVPVFKLFPDIVTRFKYHFHFICYKYRISVWV